MVRSIPVDGTPKGRIPAARKSQLLWPQDTNNANGTSQSSQRRGPCDARWLGVRKACHAATVHSTIRPSTKSSNVNQDLGRKGQYIKARKQNAHKNAIPARVFPNNRCPAPGRAADSM